MYFLENKLIVVSLWEIVRRSAMLNFSNGFATFSIKIFCLLSTYLLFIFVFDLKDHVLSPNIIDAVIDKIRSLAAFLFISTGVYPDKIEVVLFLISFYLSFICIC